MADILPYAHNISYARQHDKEWQVIIQKIQALINKVIILQKLKRQQSKWDRIPQETLFEIVSYLDATSLYRSSVVCRLWKKLCSNEPVWENLCQKQFSISTSYFKSPTLRTPTSAYNNNLEEQNSNPDAKQLYKMASSSLVSILRGKTQSDISNVSSIPIRMQFAIFAH